MKTSAKWLCIFLLGSAWGLLEIFSESLNTVWISAFALFALAASRAVVNRPGSSTLLGVVAMLYKLANTEPFYCHLLAIAITGAAFDAAATVLLRREKISAVDSALTGALSAYTGHALFAFLMAFVFRYEYWTGPGLIKLKGYIGIIGSQVALAGLFMVPLGFLVGTRLVSFSGHRPRWATVSLASGSIAVWLVGFLAL